MASIAADAGLAERVRIGDDADGSEPAAAATVRPLWLWLCAASSLLIGFSALRAIARGYVPIDDNAVIELRSRDVLSLHPPLIGGVSSASNTGDTVHHPGALLFDVLAVPVRLLPHGTGVAVGVGLLQIAVMWLIGWCAARLLGSAGAAVVVTMACALIWAIGSEALYEAWQPIVTMLPFFLALVSAWAFAAGRDEAGVVVVLACSFVTQTHGSYLVLGPAVLVAALAGRIAAIDRRAVGRRPLVGAVVVGLAVWAQPLVDQLWGSGNLARVLRFARDGGARDGAGATLGLDDGIRAAAMVLVKPPFWLRSGVASSLPNGGGLVRRAAGRVFDPDWLSLPIAAAGLVAIVGVLVMCGMLGRRSRDDVVAAGALVCLVALLAAVLSLSGLPVDEFGFSAHKARWLWPIGAFLTVYLAVVWLRLAAVPSRVQAVNAVAIFGGIALVATVPTTYQLLSPQQYMVDSYDAARELRAAGARLAGHGTIFLDTSGRPFPDPYSDTLAAELDRLGIPFRVSGDYIAGQYGAWRRLDPSDAGNVTTARILVGFDALITPEGYERLFVTFHGPSPMALVIAPGIAPSAG